MKITIEITDRGKAESLLNAVYNQMHLLDNLFEKSGRPSTKKSADDLEEFTKICGLNFTIRKKGSGI